jgi:NADPH2:quinone reductase
MFTTDDMIEQHNLLNYVSSCIDKGVLRTTLSETLRPINAENLRKAHVMLERGDTIGKVVLADWS